MIRWSLNISIIVGFYWFCQVLAAWREYAERRKQKRSRIQDAMAERRLRLLRTGAAKWLQGGRWFGGHPPAICRATRSGGEWSLKSVGRREDRGRGNGWSLIRRLKMVDDDWFSEYSLTMRYATEVVVLELMVVNNMSLKWVAFYTKALCHELGDELRYWSGRKRGKLCM